MTPRLQKLFDSIQDLAPAERLGELTVKVKAADYRASAQRLRDQHGFEQMIDLCGVDYGAYADKPREGPRFAVVVHLLSVQHNPTLSAAMGRFDVETRKRKKDTKLVQFEARVSATGLWRTASEWVAYAEKIFRAAATTRTRPTGKGKTGLEM